MTTAAEAVIPPTRRYLIIAASLLTLFLGALDALVMAAAMPTVVAQLGGIDLYSWVYSAYLLSRTIALPIFGKLADTYRTKPLYAFSILIFVAASLAAGFSKSMLFLIICRAVQGIGAGGNFALVYIVLTDVSPPGERGKTLSLGSFVWGLASVLGPTMGGFVVTYLSWPWIFFINIPLGLLSLAGVSLYLVEMRLKKRSARIDYAGALTLTVAILALLLIFLLAGQTLAWNSPWLLALGSTAIGFGFWFVAIERRVPSPLLSIAFFKQRGFSVGNAAVFFSSFAIFALFGFAPLFIQGALGKSPLAVGKLMLALSLGWSLGSLILGRVVHRSGCRNAAILGAFCLLAGCGLTLTFTTSTGMAACFGVFAQIGVGMGFVSLATILVVQNSVAPSDLGAATASHQFSRNLGGTVGVGLCGGIFTIGFTRMLPAVWAGARPGTLPPNLADQIHRNAETVLRPEIQALLTPELRTHLHAAVAHGVLLVFWTAVAAALLCLACCLLLPRDNV